MKEANNINTLLNKSFDELSEIVGGTILDSTLGGKAASQDEKRAIGRSWFNKHLSNLAALVCNNKTVQSYISDPHSRRKSEVISAIADLIISAIGAIPGIVVAIMLFHYGLDSLCGEKSE